MSRLIDLKPAHLNLVIALIRQYLPNTRVWAFGSRVKFTAKPHSDLDLVAFSTKNQAAQLSSLKEALEESSLSIRIDLHRWDDLPQTFQHNIQTDFAILHPEASDFLVPENNFPS